VWRSEVSKALDRGWVCLLAGTSMAFAYAPLAQGWLAYVLLLPLWLAAQHPDPNTRIRRGALFGLGYFPLGAYWFAQTLSEHLGYGPLKALAGHLLITGACALAPTVFCWLAGYLRLRPMAWNVAAAALWMLIEDIRFQAFGGGPWMSLGLSQIDSPLSGYYPVLGEVGTSFMVAWLVGLLTCLLRAGPSPALPHQHGLSVAIAMPIIGLGAILGERSWTQPVGAAQPVALVQSAVSQRDKSDLSTQKQRLDVLAKLSEPYLGQAKLVIWPETVVTLDKYDVNASIDALSKQAMFARSTILVGAYEPTLTGNRYNTAFTIGYEADQVYRKRHLVPFGEYVPDYLSFLTGHVPGDGNRSLGKSASLIANSGVLYGISICWEGSFSRDMSPLVRAGAHVLVNIANEAWFAGSTLPAQNLDALRVRAMETGRSAIRVANHGPGAIIDAKGRLSAQLPADRESGAMGSVQPMTGVTPFVLFGEDGLALIALALLAGAALRSRRNWSANAGQR
jgi:apolipoprotein N-acyltransferase